MPAPGFRASELGGLGKDEVVGGLWEGEVEVVFELGLLGVEFEAVAALTVSIVIGGYNAMIGIEQFRYHVRIYGLKFKNRIINLTKSD